MSSPNGTSTVTFTSTVSIRRNWPPLSPLVKPRLRHCRNNSTSLNRMAKTITSHRSSCTSPRRINRDFRDDGRKLESRRGESRRNYTGEECGGEACITRRGLRDRVTNLLNWANVVINTFPVPFPPGPLCERRNSEECGCSSATCRRRFFCNAMQLLQRSPLDASPLVPVANIRLDAKETFGNFLGGAGQEEALAVSTAYRFCFCWQSLTAATVVVVRVQD